MPMDIGEVIKRVRESKGITQKELAVKTKLPHNTIHRYENEYSNKIPPDRLDVIAKALGISVGTVYQYRENPTLLEEPANFLEEYRAKTKVSVMIELDGSVDTMNKWISTIKRLNAAI